MSEREKSSIAGLIGLVTMVAMGCGDDVSCPDDTMLVGGACVTVDLGMGDMGECEPTGDETCDGTDEDCDGMVDEGLGTMAFFTDADEDGFGDDASPVDACGPMAGLADVGGDCDDSDAEVNPAATESCNGVDDDCDGGVDDGLLRAGEPVALGIEGFVIAPRNLIPYGDGYFCSYYDSALSQGLYFLVDQAGAVTAGPLRITMEPVNDFLIFAVEIDDERIAIIWPEEDTGGDFDIWGRVLNPGTPADHTEPQQVLPALDGIPGLAVLDDRLVVWESPLSTEAATTPGRAFSYDLTFEDGTGPVSVERPNATPPLDVRFVGAFGDENGYVSLSTSVEALMQPVDPTTLTTSGERQPAYPDLVLLEDAPIEAFRVGAIPGFPNFRAGYVETLAADGSSTTLTETHTGIAVADERAQLGYSHHTGPIITAMACYEDGDAVDECRYQFLEADLEDPISDPQPLTSPTGDSVGFPRMASNGDHLAAIIHNGDPSAGPPDLYFVPFECPAP